MPPLVCIVCHTHSYNDSSENRLSARSTPAEKPYKFQPNRFRCIPGIPWLTHPGVFGQGAQCRARIVATQSGAKQVRRPTESDCPCPNPLTGNIALPQRPELMPPQSLFCHIVILHAQGHDGLPLRMRNKRVQVVDVELGL